MADSSKEQIVGVVGLFDDVDELISAAEKVCASGAKDWDCHTPYPVHGLDKAMGLEDSPMPYVTLTAGFVGLTVAILMTAGLNVFHYPIQIGGKALFSWQAFVPIYFELFVLFAAVATFLGVIVFCRLGRWHSPLHDSGVMGEITCNRFAIVMRADAEAGADVAARKVMEGTGCRDIRPLVTILEEGTSIL